MAMTNRERVGRALDLLQLGLARFISRELGEQPGGRFASMDVLGLLNVMIDRWNEVFSGLGSEERNRAFELRNVRHRWAHQKPFSLSDTYRALDSTQRLLKAASATTEGREVERMAGEVLRKLAAEQGGTQQSKPLAPHVGEPTIAPTGQRDGVRFIAVDWSGAERPSAQKKGIWLAEVVGGELRRLECGRTRDEIVDILVKEIRKRDVVIGLDFAFSFPQWYLQWRKLSSARELWELAVIEGDEWLSGRTWPFWGRPGLYQRRPKELMRSCQFRQTEEEVSSRKMGQPKSVFQVFGAGAVGTGTVRGLPALARLQDAGAAIWPFDSPKEVTVVEIFPRSLTGEVVKNDAGARADYLERRYPELAPRWRQSMQASDDSFDAGVSALVMSAHAEDFRRLEQATTPPKSLEGEIWFPS